MQVGDINVKMAADMADLRTGFEQAQAQAAKFGDGVGKAVDFAKNALIALGVVASIQHFAGLIKQAIDAADALNDLSQKTGIAVETLGALGYAGKQSGVDMETLAKGMQKMAVLMAEAAGGSDKASSVFAAMGVSIQGTDGSLKSIDETMFAVADQFKNYKDGPEKAALAQEIFGKSGAALIPLLNLGADKLRELKAEYEKYGGVTTDTAQKADEFNDVMAKIQLIQGAFTRELAAALLPTLKALADIFVDVKGQGNGFGAGITAIVGVIKVLAITVLGVIAIFKALGEKIAGVGLAVVRFATGDFKGALNAIKDADADAMATMQTFRDRAEKIWDASGKAMVKSSEENGPKASAPIVKAAKDIGDSLLKEWEALEKLREKWLQVLDATKEGLAPSTLKDFEELNALLATGEINWEQYNAALQIVLDKDPILAAEQKEINANLDAMAKLVEKVNEARAKELNSLDEAIAKQIQSNDTFGMGKTAVVDYTIAELERQQAFAAGVPGEEGAIDQLQRRIDKLHVLRDEVALGEGLEEQKKNLESSQKLWDSYVNNISQAFGGFVSDWMDKGFNAAAKNAWANFKKWAFEALAQIAAKQVVLSIAGAVGLTGAAGAAAGGLTNAAGGGAGSLLSNLIGPGLSSAASALGIGAGSAFSAALGAGFSSGIATLSIAAEAGTAAIGGIGSALGALGAVAGPVALGLGAVYLAFKAFSQAPGGPKEGGFATSGNTSGITSTDNTGRWFTPNQSDSMVSAIVGGLHDTFSSVISSLGGSGNIGFALGFSTDPKGTSSNNVHAGVFQDGQSIYNAELPNLGRDPKALEGALTEQAKLMLLAAFKASGVAESITAYLAAIPTDKFDAAIADLSNSANALKQIDTKAIFGEIIDLPKLMELVPAGASVSATLGALIDVFATTNGIAALLGKDMTTAFGEVGLASLDARQNLVDLAGGTKELATLTSQFYNTFYTDAEKLQMSQTALANGFGSLQAQFPDLIKSIPTTKDEFKALVKGLDLSTESGRQAYVQLMQLAPTFASVASEADKAAVQTQHAADAMAAAARDLASQTQKLQQIQMQLHGITGSSLDVVNRNSAVNEFASGKGWATQMLQSSGMEEFVKNLSNITAEDYKNYSAADRDLISQILTLQLQINSANNSSSGSSSGSSGGGGGSSGGGSVTVTVDPAIAALTALAYKLASFADATNKLNDALDRDPQAEALAQVAAAHETTYSKALKAREGLADLLAKYDGTTEGTEKLTAATNAYVNAQVAALVEIENLKTGLAGMFKDSIAQLDWAIMSGAERQAFLLKSAAEATELLKKTVDPAEIQRLSGIINKDLVDAFNMLSPEEQKAQHDAFVKRLAEADALAQAQLEAARLSVSKENAAAQKELADIRTAMAAAAAKQEAAGLTFVEAAEVIKNAAATNASAAAQAALTAAAGITVHIEPATPGP